MSKPVLVFHHVPKTAGTTWRAILYAHSADGAVCPVYDGDDYYYKHAEFAALPEEHKRKFDVFIGHFAFGFHRRLPAGLEPRFGAFLREPVERCKSLLGHLSRIQRKGEAISVAQLLAEGSRQFDNHQVRLLSGLNPAFGKVDDASLRVAIANLEAFEFVGLTERFDEAHFWAAEKYAWRAEPYLPLNLTPGEDRARLGAIPEADIGLLREANMLDARLYEHASVLFESRVRAMGPAWAERLEAFRARLARGAPPSAGRSVGVLEKVGPRRVRGWARVSRSSEPARVRIFIAGVPAGVAIANQYRNDLRQMGAEPGGRCAFEFQYPPQTRPGPGALIEAIALADGRPLRDSPKALVNRIEAKEIVAKKTTEQPREIGHMAYAAPGGGEAGLRIATPRAAKAVETYAEKVCASAGTRFFEARGCNAPLAGVAMICFTNRCGSNYFAELLQSTGVFDNKGEVFNLESIRNVCRKQAIDSFGQYAHQVLTPSAGLRTAVKIAWPHLVQFGRAGLLNGCFAAPRYVWVRRRDFVAQAVSLHIAKVTGKWSPKQKGAGAIVPYDYGAIARGIEHIFHGNENIHQFLVCTQQPFIEVCYEDLSASPQATLARVFEFLGIAAAPRLDPDKVGVKVQRNEVNETFRNRFLTEARGRLGVPGGAGTA